MSRTSVARFIKLSGKTARCNHLRPGFVKDGVCGQLLVKDDAIMCPRCKHEHLLTDLVAILAQDREDKLGRLVAAINLRFWVDKSIADMETYYAGEVDIPAWPQWLRDRIDLVVKKYFIPVFVWHNWVLIERHPTTFVDLGPIERQVTSANLPAVMDRYAAQIWVGPSRVQLPTDVAMLQTMHRVRNFIARRDGWPNGTSWLNDFPYWVSCGHHYVANPAIGSQDQPQPDQWAMIQPFIIG